MLLLLLLVVRSGGRQQALEVLTCCSTPRHSTGVRCRGVLEFLSSPGLRNSALWGNFYVAFWHLAGGVTLLGFMLLVDDASTTCTGAAR